MKRFFSIILLAVICLAAVSCSKSSDVDVPDGMKLASNDDDLFYFFVPNDWTFDRGYGNPYAYASGNDNSNVNVMFHLLNEEPVSDGTREPYIDAYWKDFETDLESGFLAYSLSESESNSTQTLDSVYAKQFVYTLKTKDKAEYKCRSVVAYRGEMIFCLTYTAEVQNYDKHKADVDKIIAEFKFKDGLLG